MIPKMHVKGHGGDEANEIQIKLAYLSMLRVDRVWDSPNQFERLFGSSELSSDLFDTWWTLSELDTEWFEELEQSVGAATPFIGPQANTRVVEWLRERAEPV